MSDKSEKTCRICGYSGSSTLYIFREMMFGFRDEFEYFQCSKCGCLQISDAPENIDKYYPDNYYSFASPHRKDYQKLKVFFRKSRSDYFFHGNNLLGYLYSKFSKTPQYLYALKKIGINPTSRILDVGSGSGSYLLRLWRQGFTNLTGIDPYLTEDVSINECIKIHKKELSDVEEQYDFIVMNHSLEHIFDQQSIFKTLAEKIKPNGYVLIRVPTVSSYAWEHYKENWVQLDPPRHFYLHSTASMHHLAESSGFRVETIEYDSTKFQFWASEQYKRDIPLRCEESYYVNRGNSIFSEAELQDFKKQTLELNRLSKGDQVCFYLQKT